MEGEGVVHKDLLDTTLQTEGLLYTMIQTQADGCRSKSGTSYKQRCVSWQRAQTKKEKDKNSSVVHIRKLKAHFVHNIAI